MDNENTNQAKAEEPRKDFIREVHHHYDNRERFSLGKLFLGIILIVVGVVFIGQNYGLFNVDLNLSWRLLWPVFIIFLGLSMIGRGGWISKLVSFLLMLLALALVFSFVLVGSHMPGRVGSIVKQEISVAKNETAKSGLIKVHTGAGRLTLNSGALGLIEGTLESDFLRVDLEDKIDGSLQSVKIEGRKLSVTDGMSKNELNLRVADDLPLDLAFETGAIDMDLDLSEIQARSIDVRTGVSSVNLKIGDRLSSSLLKVNAGVSSVNISLPKTIGARIRIDSDLASKDLLDFIKIDDKTYESSNYDTSTKKIEIQMQVGVSSVNINWR